MKSIIKVALGSLFLSLLSCSDWTEVESLKIHEPSIEETIGEANYQMYLANLRNYKTSKHYVVYGYFDNTMEFPKNGSNNITEIPDSVDIISLKTAEIKDYQSQEIIDTRKSKGTAFVCNIRYDDILEEYNHQVTENQNEFDENAFLKFLISKTNEQLDLCSQFELDGISVWYNPINMEHLGEVEKGVEKIRQETFISLISAWLDNNKEKMFVYEGNPCFLIDKSLLEQAKYIVVHAEDVEAVYDLTSFVKRMLVEGVPEDRFILMTSAFSLDSSDKKTGYISDEKGEKTSAILKSVEWCKIKDDDMCKCGIGIYDIQNDYFNPNFTYSYTRTAISVLNPSPRNVGNKSN